jgi:lipase (class 3)
VDLNQAIQFGLLVKAAETVAPANTANAAGQTVPATYDPDNIGYRVVSTILGNDLATNMNPGRGHQSVSFGFILQAPNNDVVIAIRGAEGMWEWIHDFEFLSTKCPFMAGAGKTDDGFTAIYNSLRAATAFARLVDALTVLPFDQASNTLTICGHSLGGTLATMLALDVAANTNFKNPTIYNYASPRMGDRLFASTYNQVVANTYRYRQPRRYCSHAAFAPSLRTRGGTLRAKLGQANSPTFLAKCELACEHHMTSYLHLILAGRESCSTAGRWMRPLTE